MSLYSPETLAELAILRRKAEEGTASMDDMRRAVLLLRQDRKAAVTSSETKRRVTAKAVIPDADTMLSELEGL